MFHLKLPIELFSSLRKAVVRDLINFLSHLLDARGLIKKDVVTTPDVFALAPDIAQLDLHTKWDGLGCLEVDKAFWNEIRIWKQLLSAAKASQDNFTHDFFMFVFFSGCRKKNV